LSPVGDRNLNRILLILMLVLLFPVFSGAAVYQGKDEKGNIVFSDKQIKDGKEVKIRKPAVFKFNKDNSQKGKLTPEQPLGEIKPRVLEPKKYTTLEIVSPEHDASFRDNMGNVQLKLDIDPPLQSKFEHLFKVKLDGKLINKEWKSSSISITNIDRGTHAVQVLIYGKNDELLKTSNQVTFHLQRFSKLFKR